MLRLAVLMAFAAASAIGQEYPEHRPMPLVGERQRQKLRYHIENVSFIEEFDQIDINCKD